MGDIIGVIVEKNYESIKDAALDHEDMRSLKNSHACSRVVLRKDTYLHKRQFEYMIRAYIANIIIAILIYTFLPRVVMWFNLSSVVGVYEVFATIILWIISTMLLVTGFIRGFYGFVYTTKVRYMLWFLAIHVGWLLADLYCAVIQEVYHRGIALLMVTLVSVVLIAIRFNVRSKAVVKFRIRAKGKSEPADAFDGEKDVSLVLADGSVIVVNLFEALLAIIENDRILVEKGIEAMAYKPDEVSTINVANQIKVAFNGKEWSVVK